MKQPSPRGDVSAHTLSVVSGPIAGQQEQLGELHRLVESALVATPDLLHDDDLQLTLFCL